MTTTDRLLSLEEAARRLGLRPGTLLRYVGAGRVRARIFVELPAPEEMPLLPPPSPDEGPDEAVSLREASRRYGVPHQMLSRWARLGLIRSHGRRGRELLVSARDARRMSEIYRHLRERSGGTFRGRSLRRILRAWGLLPG